MNPTLENTEELTATTDSHANEMDTPFIPSLFLPSLSTLPPLVPSVKNHVALLQIRTNFRKHLIDGIAVWKGKDDNPSRIVREGSQEFGKLREAMRLFIRYIRLLRRILESTFSRRRELVICPNYSL